MPQISETIEIGCDIKKVREIFQDFTNYPNWTAFIKSIEVTTPEKTSDTVAAGDQLKVTINLPKSGKENIFTPTVLENSESCFKWCGRLYSDYIFSGEHSFTFKQLENGRTEVTQSENFSGLLSSPIFMFIGEETKEGFRLYNAALKKKSEEKD